MYERGEGGREREREKRGREEFGPVLNGNLERREEKRRRERKSGERFILRTGERRKRAKERKEGERKTGIGIFFFFLAPFTLMTQRGFQLNSPGQEELMVSFRGSRAEGRNLNALG